MLLAVQSLATAYCSCNGRGGTCAATTRGIRGVTELVVRLFEVCQSHVRQGILGSVQWLSSHVERKLPHEALFLDSSSMFLASNNSKRSSASHSASSGNSMRTSATVHVRAWATAGRRTMSKSPNVVIDLICYGLEQLSNEYRTSAWQG